MIGDVYLIEHEISASETGVLEETSKKRKSIYYERLKVYVTLSNGHISIEFNKKYEHSVSEKLNNPPDFIKNLFLVLNETINSKDTLSEILAN